MTGAELRQAAHELVDDLVELRLNRGISQGEIAECIGINRTAVSCFEHHRRDPRLITLLRYADAVGAEIGFTMRRSS